MNPMFEKLPVLMVPGWQDSGKDHWQTLWQKEFNWGRVVQDDWLKPRCTDWVDRFVTTIKAQSGPVVLVTHSLGCSTLAHAWAMDQTLPIRAAFIIAPPDLEQPDTPQDIKNFSPVPEVQFSFPSIVIASQNDPYCAVRRAQRMAKSWGGQFMNVGDRHHLGDSANLGDWKEGLILLAEFLG